MAAQLFYMPFLPVPTQRGLPAGAAKAFFYVSGTTTLAPVYAEAALSTALENPVTADAFGRLPDIYLDDATVYRVRVLDSKGAQIGTDVDPYYPGQAVTIIPSLPQLLASDGASKVGFKQNIASSAYLSVLSKLRSGRVNVMDGFGVKMDGVTNDGTAINLAVSALHDAGGGTLEIPRGLLLTDQISLPATNGGGVSLRGEGQRATYIRKATSTSTVPLIYASASASGDPTETYIGLSGFALQPATGTGGVADAMMLERVAKFDISDIDFRDAKTGIVLKGSLIGSLSNFNIQGCKTGVLTGANDGNTPYPNEINLWGGVISDCTQYGIDSAGSGLHLHGVDMERNGTSGQLDSGHIVYRATSDDEIGSSFCSIQGVWMEGGFGRGVYVEPGMGGMFSLALNDTQILGQAGPSAVFGSGIISANNVRLPSPGDTWTVLNTAAYCSVTNSNIANISDALPRHLKHYRGIRGAGSTLASGGMASDFTVGSGKSVLWRSLDGSIQHEMGIDPTTSRLRYVPSNALGVDMGGLQFVGALTVAADNAAAAAAGVPSGHLYRTADGAIRYRP